MMQSRSVFEKIGVKKASIFRVIFKSWRKTINDVLHGCLNMLFQTGDYFVRCVYQLLFVAILLQRMLLNDFTLTRPIRMGIDCLGRPAYLGGEVSADRCNLSKFLVKGAFHLRWYPVCSRAEWSRVCWDSPLFYIYAIRWIERLINSTLTLILKISQFLSDIIVH